MDMRLLLIPAVLVLIAIIMVVVMKQRHKQVGRDGAKQEMERFVREQLPHMNQVPLHIIGAKGNSEHMWVIAYNEEDLFIIPAVSNPLTMKISRYEDLTPTFKVKNQIAKAVLAGDATEKIDYVPTSAITAVEVNPEARTAKISVRENTKTYKFLKTDFFGNDHSEELHGFFAFLTNMEIER